MIVTIIKQVVAHKVMDGNEEVVSFDENLNLIKSTKGFLVLWDFYKKVGGIELPTGGGLVGKDILVDKTEVVPLNVESKERIFEIIETTALFGVGLKVVKGRED